MESYLSLDALSRVTLKASTIILNMQKQVQLNNVF